MFLDLQVFKTIMIQKIIFFLSLVFCSWAIAVPEPNEFKIFSAVPDRTTSKLPPDYPTECPVVANEVNCEKSNVSIYLISLFFNSLIYKSQKLKKKHYFRMLPLLHVRPLGLMMKIVNWQTKKKKRPWRHAARFQSYHASLWQLTT